ncbi:hypothetical protein C7999DRAFT_12371 [Corynascus novoguineensis]|uniref:Nicotinamide N-methyltransferase n=1 Tax=Corynascus novoguineensis TaxID=1126955 RepID=A0AAN7HLH6_9PEZI|nr:hypothetical protein C7999DRAFT_12371 [Corynascus novoguineensis]
MALAARISPAGPETSDPEDLFASSLGVIFPDDVTNMHGDPDHALLYKSPHLPRPIKLALADVKTEEERFLFSHHLWNASLLLAEFIEAGTLGLEIPWTRGIAAPLGSFDVSALRTIELGAGTALPSIMAGLLGAKGVVVTDYPSPPVLKTLRENVTASVKEASAPSGRFAAEEVLVEGHGWGELDTPLAEGNRHAFDRVIAADCLWMPWQHDNLRRSISWFLADAESARAWVVAGFHTGRQKVSAFFETAALAELGLEVEHMWERDCDGKDREWVTDRDSEDISERKRWLVVGVLRRIRKPAQEGEQRP